MQNSRHLQPSYNAHPGLRISWFKKPVVSLLLFSCSVVCDSSVTPQTVALQGPLYVGFSRQEYWSGLLFPSPGDLPDPGVGSRSPVLQAGSLPLSHQGSPNLAFCPSGLPLFCSLPRPKPLPTLGDFYRGRFTGQFGLQVPVARPLSSFRS